MSPLFIIIIIIIIISNLMYPRVKEKLKTGELMVAGDQWPVFLYSGYIYDAEDPWDSLFRSAILVSVSHHSTFLPDATNHPGSGLQTHLYLSKLH